MQAIDNLIVLLEENYPNPDRIDCIDLEHLLQNLIKLALQPAVAVCPILKKKSDK